MISIEEHTSKKMRESIVNFTDFIQSIIFIGSIFNAVIAPVLGRNNSCYRLYTYGLYP